MRCMEDASYMNLKMVAEVMLNKEDQVVTVGVDDTTKAAGRRLYDVKNRSYSGCWSKQIATNIHNRLR